MSRGIPKQERQAALLMKLKQDPFLTDEELSRVFCVSIQTIRLDRMEIGIPELRQRIRELAAESYGKVKSISGKEIVGELIDLELGKSGISVLQTDSQMAFEKTKVVRGHFIFAQAESLAIAVIDAPVALTGVANIKYKFPVHAGEKLVAKAEVVRVRANKYFVWVKTKVRDNEAFRGKFILVSLQND
ncbi:transcription factor FapR [Mahella sp.]|uniref:transcription factor FapR n=1 Tax=Mahella sp. TaxID=2798721 RepID=UPI0025BE8275|nr:transcription factor FapR [Mahella sp.]MBZ4664994.1 fatty acid biosynthesis transcriptional regulator [Mahella sp.]